MHIAGDSVPLPLSTALSSTALDVLRLVMPVVNIQHHTAPHCACIWTEDAVLPPLEVSLGPSPTLWQGLSPFGLGFWNRLNIHFLTHSLFHCFFLHSSELERYTGQSTERAGYLRNSFSMQSQNKFFN